MIAALLGRRGAITNSGTLLIGAAAAAFTIVGALAVLAGPLKRNAMTGVDGGANRPPRP